MRFEYVHIRRYGCLEDVDIGTPETALPSIVVILGPNESGKSTFFSFLTTLLYGFRPAKRMTNPYTPWLGEDPPEGHARIRLDDGKVQEIHRRLLAAPWGRLHTNGRTESVSNRALPRVAALGHVPRGVFEQVYALTLAELSGLEGKSWDLVQERLVGSMGADLRPAGKIVSGFEDEAKRLWRPDNMGKPLHKRLQAELTALKERRRAAQKRDQDLRRKDTELAEAETEGKAREARREQKQKRRTVTDRRLNVLLPVRKKLSRIEDLRVRAGSSEELAGLPLDPRGHLKTLRDREREAESLVGDLGRQADHCREVIESERPNICVLDYRQSVLLPVRKKLSRIEELRVRAGPDHELTALPEDPKRHLDRLRERHGDAKARVAELDQEAVSGRQKIATSERGLQKVATVEQQVSAAAGRLGDLTRRVKEAERRADALNVRCRDHAKDLLSVSWEQVDRSNVSAVPVGELEERVRKYQGISKQRVDDEDSGPEDGALRPGRGRLVVAVTAVVVGGLLLLPAVGLDTPVPLDDVFAWALGGSAVIVGFFLGTRWRAEVGRADRASARWSKRVATLKSDEQAAREEVGELVGRLPIHGWLLEPPSFNLLLERIRRMVELANDLAESKPVVARRRESLDDETSRLKERMADEIRKLQETTTVPVHEDLRTQANALQEAVGTIQDEINVTKIDLAKTEANVRKARDELRETANGLDTFRRTLASFGDGTADPGLTEVVERLDARQLASQLRAELEREQPDLDELVARIDEAEADGERWDTLKERLKTARKARDEAKGKLENIESLLEKAKKKRNTFTGELRAFTGRLASFGDGNVDRRLTEAVERLDARHRARQLRAELERDQPDLDEVVAQIHEAEADGETWDSLPEDLKAMDESLQALIDEEPEQGELIGKVKSEIQSIQQEETASQVQGEIEVVEAQILDAKESRDRLFLLARLAQEADRRFRERHQPALLKEAGKYVDQITGGRYDRIVIGEAGEKFFSLRDPANSRLRKMSDPFSQGIKEQVYFALRLAAIDHLDADNERLPLFLDEVFVNWDLQRLDRAFELVEQVARQRQVFFFTCHKAMATKLEDSGGMIIDLG